MKMYLHVLKNYANLQGRARRNEYWMFTLIHVIILVLLALIGTDFAYVIFTIYYFATIIPYVAVTVRRLHDIGRSGWWILIRLIPIAGEIVILVLMCLESEERINKYGSNLGY